MRATRIGRVLFGLAVLVAIGAVAEATVKMQRDARKLGFVVENCHYCHASKSSEVKMTRKAREAGLSSLNCIQCHGEKLPDKLNDRGRWLVSERKKRGSKEFDMAWLEDYVEEEEEQEQEKKPPE